MSPDRLTHLRVLRTISSTSQWEHDVHDPLWLGIDRDGDGESAGAAQQKQQRADPFDGHYSGTMNCSGGSNARFNGLTIRQSKFTHVYKSSRGSGSRSCSLEIKPDGSFENEACDIPTKGKAAGDSVEFSFKGPERLCDVHLTRDKS
jgi:hypothetical protein